jgi:hypothetical protein
MNTPHDNDSSWESNLNKQQNQFHIDYDLIYMKDSLKPKYYTSKSSTLTTVIKPQSIHKTNSISSDEESLLNKLHISDVSKFVSISKKNKHNKLNSKDNSMTHTKSISNTKSISHPYFSNIISTLPSFNSSIHINDNNFNNDNSNNDNVSGFIRNRVSSFRIID